MKKEEFYYLSADKKTTIHAVEWKPDIEIKGIVQIAHGMTEYILRYEAFAKFLTEKGFVVVGNDHLGHGTSIAKNAPKMYFGPVGSWNWVVNDFQTCMNITKEKYPKVPYCILGFSLGSFLIRSYLIDNSNSVDLAIIMGTGETPLIQIILAKCLANNEIKKIGETNSSPLIQKLSFGNYNRLFRPTKTEFDWLYSSKTALEEYLVDPLRGNRLSAGMFREMLSGVEETIKTKNMKKMKKNLPIFLMSGEEDPVGLQGKQVRQVYKKFKKIGITDVSIKLYPKARHDILHEDIKDQVFNDIYNWINVRV